VARKEKFLSLKPWPLYYPSPLPAVNCSKWVSL
jgi:hypothetical protein